MVFSYLQDKEAITLLFSDIAEKIANRPGGYTRILKTGFRLGDNAEMCIIEMVDYNANLLKEGQKGAKAEGGGKKRRTRRGTGKGKTETAAKA
jgi:large subunit ribosomal protein L17